MADKFIKERMKELYYTFSKEGIIQKFESLAEARFESLNEDMELDNKYMIKGTYRATHITWNELNKYDLFDYTIHEPDGESIVSAINGWKISEFRGVFDCYNESKKYWGEKLSFTITDPYGASASFCLDPILPRRHDSKDNEVWRDDENGGVQQMLQLLSQAQKSHGHRWITYYQSRVAKLEKEIEELKEGEPIEAKL